MKSKPWILCASVSLLLCACQKNTQKSDVVAQRFVHKYGFDVPQTEWNERKEGQVVTAFDSGVSCTRSYANGVLHGPSSYTYPNSSVLERLEFYDEGSLLKTVFHDSQGIPFREDVLEFDNRKIVTLWYKSGAPASIEEFENGTLVKGQYFNLQNEQEASIEEGSGTRLKRDRSGVLLSKDRLEKGDLLARTSYHPNGTIQSQSSYHNYQLHGKQTTYSPSGAPLLELSWENGLLNGLKILYQNGIKTQEVPFVHGKIHGIEKHYNETGELVAEIHWIENEKHGSSHYYEGENTKIEWFYKGTPVSLKQFDQMELRDQMISELQGRPPTFRQTKQ